MKDSDDVGHETAARKLSGWLVLPIWLLLALGAAGLFFGPMVTGHGKPGIFGIFSVPVLFFLAKGFFILEPNVAAVMTFFGKYAGSAREAGFFWVNPFYKKQKFSLRAHNLNTPTLKVNDAAGNPIEVAAVIVWRVYDTARAAFDVEDYVDYITIQSESAVRQVTS
ncbi:MAG: SPFH domain-containing protein [Gammaproteobacteria bacterium]